MIRIIVTQDPISHTFTAEALVRGDHSAYQDRRDQPYGFKVCTHVRGHKNENGAVTCARERLRRLARNLELGAVI